MIPWVAYMVRVWEMNEHYQGWVWFTGSGWTRDPRYAYLWLAEGPARAFSGTVAASSVAMASIQFQVLEVPSDASEAISAGPGA